jgi:hypothetical protein
VIVDIDCSCRTRSDGSDPSIDPAQRLAHVQLGERAGDMAETIPARQAQRGDTQEPQAREVAKQLDVGHLVVDPQLHVGPIGKERRHRGVPGVVERVGDPDLRLVRLERRKRLGTGRGVHDSPLHRHIR